MKSRQKTFVTIFPNYKDFHFYKDPGQIPFRLSKLGYLSSLVFYSDGSPLPETGSNINLVRIPDNIFTRRFNIGIMVWLIRHSKKIDILNLYHFSWASMLFSGVYKLFNHNGFSYLKLDASRRSGWYQWEADFIKGSSRERGEKGSTSFKNRIKNHIIKKKLVSCIDLWSVEDTYTCNAYKAEYDFFGEKLITVFNGHVADIVSNEEVMQYEKKENIILTVGRLGTEQKATELLLEAFRLIADRCNYSLHLAGSVEPLFEDFIKNFLAVHKELGGRIIFHGELKKKDLLTLYNRSKIFCLPSRYEGMALVFPEAMYFRNVVVTTAMVSPAGIIKENELGIVVSDLGDHELANALLSIIEDQDRAKKIADNAHEFSKCSFNWDNIVTELDREIVQRQKMSE
jgi:glycosyltransferase involved in cell wall biosynthesis